MDDAPEKPAETPMQRALRTKKAALERRRGQDPTLRPQQNKNEAPGASKPWMKK